MLSPLSTPSPTIQLRPCAPHLRAYTRFTLIELLVVILIISILAAMLLPALVRVRSSAKTAKCISNLKQIHLSWRNYVDDYDGFLPIYHSGYWSYPHLENLPGGVLISGYFWINMLGPYANCEVKPWPDYPAGFPYWGQYSKLSVLICPERGNDLTPFCDYGIFYHGVGGVLAIPGISVYRRDSDIKNHAEQALIGDAGSDWSNPIGPRISGNSSDIHWVGWRHLGRANLSHCDGHVETLHLGNWNEYPGEWDKGRWRVD